MAYTRIEKDTGKLWPGSFDKKKGNAVSSFIKQRWNVDEIFLPPFLPL
jgi:hypothetical protein